MDPAQQLDLSEMAMPRNELLRVVDRPGVVNRKLTTISNRIESKSLGDQQIGHLPSDLVVLLRWSKFVGHKKGHCLAVWTGQGLKARKDNPNVFDAFAVQADEFAAQAFCSLLKVTVAVPYGITVGITERRRTILNFKNNDSAASVHAMVRPLVPREHL